MLELKDGFVLYHGSYCEVKRARSCQNVQKRKRFWTGILFNHIKGTGRKVFLELNSQSHRNRETIEEGQKLDIFNF